MVRKKFPQTKSDKPKKELRGRESIYDPNIHPEIAENLCARHGLVNEELAKAFGIGKITLYDWTVNYPELKEAIKRGKDRFDSEQIENSLRKRALGYEYEEQSIEEITVKAEDEEGLKVQIPAKKIITYKKSLAADVKAIIFWLQNRDRDRWINTQYLNVKSDKKVSHEHNINLKLTEKQLSNMEEDELRALQKLVAATAMDDRESVSGTITDRIH